MPRLRGSDPFPHYQEASQRFCAQGPNASRSRIRNGGGAGHVGVECESTHIFDKKDCLTKWLSTYTGKQGLVLSLPEYMGSLNQRLPTKYHEQEHHSITTTQSGSRVLEDRKANHDQL